MDNASDKKKIFILRAVIAFIILLIVLFSIVAILDFQSDKNNPKYLSTTTRRTYKRDSTTTKLIVHPTEEEGENSKTTTTTTAKSSTGTTKRQSSSTTTTTKKTTASGGQTSSPSPIPEVPNYNEATGSTNHANAEDSWEWYIADKINEIRVKNGLNRLIVAVELREIAESAGDVYNTRGEDAVHDYLDGYNNYRFWTINQSVNKDYLVNNTINATSITTNKYYTYMGVGVIKHINNQNGLPSYHYCIIYQ